MKRRTRTQEPAVDPQGSGIPPFIDQFGREVWDNPWGQYRPNPRLAGETRPVVRSATGLPVIPPPAAETEPAPTPAPAEHAAAAPVVELAPATHQVTNGCITADDERIRSTIQYAKGYAKACKSLGVEIPEEMRARLKHHTAQRLGRVHKRVRCTAAVVTAVGAGFVGINAAAAFYSAHGSGTGAASAGTLQAPTGVSAAALSNLQPGSSSDLSVTLTNPNSYTIQISKIQQGAGTITGCTAPDISVPTQTLTGKTVAPGTHTVTISNGVAMGTNSSSDCQGVSFTNIPVTLTVQTP